MTGKALVTGGAGFIGSHVADLLLAHRFDVHVLDDLSSGRRENVPAGATFHEADLTSAAAAHVVRTGQFDVVCHLAAQIDVRRSVSDPALDAAVNIGGTLNVLEAVRASGRRARVIFSSTGGAIYGDFATPPAAEVSPKDPESPYGVSKLAAEHYLAYYGRVHGIACVALRYANVYGPRQDPHGEAGVVAIFCGRILRSEPLTVYGDGSQTRDYVYVGDVARANLLAATASLPEAGRLDARAYNIGTGVETSVCALAAELQRVAGHEVGVSFAPPRAGEQQRSAVAIDRAASALGWRPQWTLAAGLAETYAYFAGRVATV